MRLNTINIKGFKSFANDTSLHFKHDVVGVVGPNGSGKSNVVDAIRWVLGEQKSKELRLESMTDVIFNGTKKRKEAGAATVEIIFENDKNILPTEYNQVSIARTLYRSGESEYRLNDVVCRLKDIKSLLVDTGIGSNSYSIIALGMVDDLLSDKEDSRRGMFEQAAGVSKYKNRKKETMAKLSGTEADLNRVEDLLFEIDGHLKTLEKQAKRTKKYFEIKEEYKNISIINAIKSVQTLKTDYKATNEAIIKKQDAYTALQSEIAGNEASLEKIKNENLHFEQAVSQKQRDLNELVYKMRTLENEKGLLEQKIDFKSQSIRSTQKNIDQHQVMHQSLQKDLTNIEEILQDEKAMEKELAEKLQADQTNLQAIRKNQQDLKVIVDQKTTLVQKIQTDAFELDKLQAIKLNRTSNIKADLERLEEQKNNNGQEIERANDFLKEAEQKKNLQQTEVDHLKNAEVTLKENIAQIEKERDETTQQLNDINRNLDAKQNEFNLLKSMVDNLEGFPESVKYLSQHWKKECPILSDLLDVKGEFRIAIELYLEPYLNYYIVDSMENAMEPIRLLASSQNGKANFFILDQFQEKPKPAVDKANAVAALNVVTIEKRYATLLAHLLEDVYIYEGSVDSLPKDYLAEQTYIHKDGYFVRRPRSIVGGSVGLFEGKKIGRKSQLKKLEDELRDLGQHKETTITKLNQTKATLNALKTDNIGQQIQASVKVLEQLSQECLKHTLNIENLKTKLGETDQRWQSLTAEMQALDDELANILVKRKELEAQKKMAESVDGHTDKDLEQLSQQLTEASAAYNAANIALIKQQNHLTNIQKENTYKQTRFAEVNAMLKQEKHKIDQDTEELEESKERMTTLVREIKGYYEQKSQFQEKLGSAEQQYFDVRNKITGLEEKIKSLHKQHITLQTEINTLKDKFNEVKFGISGVSERLNIEFGVNINDIINQEPDPNVDYEGLGEKVEALRNRLQNYGEINPLALEAYEEMKTRYELITTQRNDIHQAKISLMETIKEIEQTATAQFMESFEQVRVNFKEVFRSLFTNDDTCDLILLEPNNPLESPIEIVAKPKGKKPRSLSQLSGGEKTLTATSLLFALYLLKPAPFCIFDEVDAPLDDANISKFNNIIKEFSSRSQFIVVTHNKATMSAVDVLYGVYMQEPGVSAVTPVDFTNYDNKAFLQSIAK